MEGGIKYTKQLPRPSKNILVWEFTKLCIRTYERGKAPCIYKIFCLGGSSCEVSENITTVWIIGGGGVKRGSCSAMDPLPPPPGEDPGIDVGGGALCIGERSDWGVFKSQKMSKRHYIRTVLTGSALLINILPPLSLSLFLGGCARARLHPPLHS